MPENGLITDHDCYQNLCNQDPVVKPTGLGFKPYQDVQSLRPLSKVSLWQEAGGLGCRLWLWLWHWSLLWLWFWLWLSGGLWC